MGFSFTINAAVFAPLGSAAVDGDYALSEITESAIVDINRYHVKGVDGSFKNFGGIIGYKLKLKFRIVGAFPQSSAEGLSDAFANSSYSIVANNGATYLRCTLEPGGMKCIRQPTACGRGTPGQQFADFEASFICDGGKA